MKKKQFYLFWICFLFFVSGCSSDTLTKYSMTSTDLGFDTVVTFTAYTKNEQAFKKYQTLLEDAFTRYSQLFDRYQTYDGIANIKTINDQAGIAPVEVDPEIIALLKLSKEYDTISQHQFDITQGNLLEVWHTYREEGILANAQEKDGKIPNPDILSQAATYRGWEHVRIDEKKQTVYIDDPNISLDVGGVAKGFAVERIAQMLEDAGCEHAIVNGGGNIRLIGSKPEAQSWSVGIQIPDEQAQTANSLVSLKMDASSSFVTSGDYQRYYMAEGQKLHHIVDPSTQMPATFCRSVTVVTKDSGIADIVSTTLFTMAYEEGQALLTQLQNQGMDIEAVWVFDDRVPYTGNQESIQKDVYTIVMSEGLQEKIIH